MQGCLCRDPVLLVPATATMSKSCRPFIEELRDPVGRSSWQKPVCGCVALPEAMRGRASFLLRFSEEEGERQSAPGLYQWDVISQVEKRIIYQCPSKRQRFAMNSLLLTLFKRTDYMHIDTF